MPATTPHLAEDHQVTYGVSVQSPARATPPTAAWRDERSLVALRVSIGVLFLILAEYKVVGLQFTTGGGYLGWIHRFLDRGGAYPFMRPVLEHVAVPGAPALAFLVAYGELAIGLALVSGFLVRTASAFGLVYMLALLFSSNYPGAHAAFWQYFGASLDHLVLAMCFAAFTIAGPAMPVWQYRRGSYHERRQLPG